MKECSELPAVFLSLTSKSPPKKEMMMQFRLSLKDKISLKPCRLFLVAFQQNPADVRPEGLESRPGDR